MEKPLLYVVLIDVIIFGVVFILNLMGIMSSSMFGLIHKVCLGVIAVVALITIIALIGDLVSKTVHKG